MPQEKMCKNHPLKPAEKHCKQCGAGLCRFCVKQTEIGYFCSDECYEKAKEFTNKVSDMTPVRKTPFLKQLGFGKVIILIVIVVVLHFVLQLVGMGGLPGVFEMIMDLF